MTNPTFHSWRLNWASLNPMFLLTHNRNKWGMAELCLRAALSHSHYYTALQLQSFENSELSCKKLCNCLKFLRFNKHCLLLSVIQLLNAELLELNFLGFGGTLFICARWHSRKIPWFHRCHPPEHTVHHPAFITSCKASFLSLILLFGCAPTHEWEMDTKRIFILVGISPRPLCLKSTEGTLLS